ncbi:Carnitine O-acetyltransferase mitochondrial [Coelomomyces lativittatus]|nr:Carnitine O-acetyltransferase mitochondrial [Coelomomyces lativittatus]
MALSSRSTNEQRGLPPDSKNRKGKTFMYQRELPFLPIPSLEETLTKYLKSSIPLLSPAELEKTTATVKEFGKNGGVGQRLQELLLQRFESEKMKGTIVPINVNYHMTFEDAVILPPEGISQTKQHQMIDIYLYSLILFANDLSFSSQAARLIYCIMKWKRMLDNEELEPDYLYLAGGKKLPLDMEQYTKLFTTTRLPGMYLSGHRLTILSILFECVCMMILEHASSATE